MTKGRISLQPEKRIMNDQPAAPHREDLSQGEEREGEAPSETDSGSIEQGIQEIRSHLSGRDDHQERKDELLTAQESEYSERIKEYLLVAQVILETRIASSLPELTDSQTFQRLKETYDSRQKGASSGIEQDLAEAYKTYAMVRRMGFNEMEILTLIMSSVLDAPEKKSGMNIGKRFSEAWISIIQSDQERKRNALDDPGNKRMIEKAKRCVGDFMKRHRDHGVNRGETQRDDAPAVPVIVLSGMEHFSLVLSESKKMKTQDVLDGDSFDVTGQYDRMCEHIFLILREKILQNRQPIDETGVHVLVHELFHARSRKSVLPGVRLENKDPPFSPGIGFVPQSRKRIALINLNEGITELLTLIALAENGIMTDSRINSNTIAHRAYLQEVWSVVKLIHHLIPDSDPSVSPEWGLVHTEFGCGPVIDNEFRDLDYIHALSPLQIQAVVRMYLSKEGLRELNRLAEKRIGSHGLALINYFLQSVYVTDRFLSSLKKWKADGSCDPPLRISIAIESGTNAHAAHIAGYPSLNISELKKSYPFLEITPLRIEETRKS